MLLARIFGADCTRIVRDHSRHSYDHVSNSLASGGGIRVRHRWYAVPRGDNSRDSVSEQKMRLCRTHDRSRVVFPRSTPTIQRNSARNCGPESHGHQVSVCLCITIQFSTIEIFDFIEI